MKKGVAQITFDFGPVEEIPPIQPVAAKETKPLPVAEEEAKQEEPVRKVKTPVAGSAAIPANKRGRKSLKEIAVSAELIQVPDDETLFKKQYYPIGEVALMFRENQSLIRYWETEFDILQPRKNRKGDRFFRPVDIKNLLMIYDLLRRRKFTIEGAKDYLKKNKKAEEKFAMIQSLQKIKGFLLELKANL